MGKIQNVTPRSWLPYKCSIDGVEVATCKLRFDCFNAELFLCPKHLEELKETLKHG
jgi:hypothetical protein